MAVDRRVLRTRNALYDALVSLVLERGYPAVTVQDILERADVGRSTFYAHFTSKDDLLARSLERLGAILRAAGAAGHAEGWSLVLFTHVAEYRQIHLALSGMAAGEVLRAAVRQVVADFVRERVNPGRGVPSEIAIAHVAATFMTVTGWWLERQPRLTPAEADKLFKELLGGAVSVC